MLEIGSEGDDLVIYRSRITKSHWPAWDNQGRVNEETPKGAYERNLVGVPHRCADQDRTLVKIPMGE
jgi:hypothetical protein